jgi:hypothetical protein
LVWTGSDIMEHLLDIYMLFYYFNKTRPPMIPQAAKFTLADRSIYIQTISNKHID